MSLTTRVVALETALTTLAEGQARTEALLARLVDAAPAKEVTPAPEVTQPKADRKPRLTRDENRALAKRYAKSLAAARKADPENGYAVKWAAIKDAEMVKLGRA